MSAQSDMHILLINRYAGPKVTRRFHREGVNHDVMAERDQPAPL